MANCPDQYIQAMRESNERSSTNERRSAGEGLDGDVNGSGTGPDDSPEFDFDRTYVDDTRPEAIN
jgi:hypothetical protein